MFADSKEKQRRWGPMRLAMATAVLLVASMVYAVYLPVPAADAPRVLVSVDRTLWNRLGFNRLTYVRTLRNAGIRPVFVDFGDFPSRPETAAAWLEGFAGLILSGGGDVAPGRYDNSTIDGIDVNAERDAFELALLSVAERSGIPILGICRGAQLLNVYRGGTLGDFRDGPRYETHHRVWPGHPVDLAADSRIARYTGTRRLDNVVTWHGQHVADPGEGVSITGRAPDGTPEVIEVEAGGDFGMIGVQWHAEIAPWDPHQQELFDAFGAAVREHTRTNRANSRL